ncbi:MAG: hypothetical protein WC939_00430 [Acholeplasmataceae bacterium]
MKKISLLLILLLMGCSFSMEKDARSETYTDPQQVIDAIKEAQRSKYKNYLFLDLREEIDEYIKGFHNTPPSEIDAYLEGLKTYTFIMVFSNSNELTSERVSYIQSKGFNNVKYIDITVETLLNALRDVDLLYNESCPPKGC